MTRHAVLGAGGVGGLVGGALARAGTEVELVLRPEAIETHPATLTIESATLGSFDVDVSRSSHLSTPVDVLWVTVKAQQLETALSAIEQSSIDDALVVPLMNGVDHVARLRSAFPRAHVVAGSIRTESTRVKPGVIVHKGWHVPPGAVERTAAGLPRPTAAIQLCGAGATRDRVEDLAALLNRAGVSTEVWNDEGYVLWNKLSILCPCAMATTAVGDTIGAARADDRIGKLMLSCAEEVLNVAASLGVELDRQETFDVIGRFPDSTTVSMQRDAAAGKPLEIEAIAGPVVEHGRARDVVVDATEELRSLAVESAARARTALESVNGG